MKTIGLLGGMSWESTASYYKIINQMVKQRLGGFHSAKICLYSVDFDEIEKLQHQDEWDKTADILSKAAKFLEAGGANFFLICTNTMHKVASQIESKVSIPLVHIADATAMQLLSDQIKCVGLLGTQFTMEEDFYKKRLTDKFNIEVLVPEAGQRKRVHEIIYSELCLGKIRDESRKCYLNIIEELYLRGAEAVILGCTEIALLVQQSDTSIRLYDTTTLHAEKAVSLALED